MDNLIWAAPVLAILALVFAAAKTSMVSKAEAGTDRMKEIANSISEGAHAFLFAEYKILVIFVAALFVLIGFFISWKTALCFLVGAALGGVISPWFPQGAVLTAAVFQGVAFLWMFGVRPQE